MKNKSGADKRRKAAAALAIVLVIAMVVSIIAPFIGAFAYGAQQPGSLAAVSLPPLGGKKGVQGDITIEEQIGFEQSYAVYRQIPVSMVLQNNGKDFSGEVRVKVYTDTNYEDTAGRYVLYYQPLELPSGASKRVTMVISSGVARNTMLIELADEQGNVVASKPSTVKYLDPDSIVTGVLTDEKDSVTYLKSMKLAAVYGYENDLDKLFFLDQESLLESSQALDMLDLLIINQYDTKQLTDGQRQAIAGWVRNGGLLIFGTGVNAHKVLDGFSEYFPVEIGEEAPVAQLTELEAHGLTALSGMTVVDIKRDGAEPLISAGKQVLTDVAPYGKGNVVIHHFDLGLSPFAGTAEAADFLSELYYYVNPDHFSNRGYNGYGSNALSGISMSPPYQSHGIVLAFCLIGGYILLIGPVCYFVLKKKDRREKGWIVIPGLAAVTMVVIFAFSRTSIYNHPIAMVVSAIDLSNDGSSSPAEISVEISSPKQGPMEVAVAEKLDVHFGDGSEYSSSRDYYDEEVCSSRIFMAQDQVKISYMDRNSWESSKFFAEKQIPFAGNIDASIALKGNTLSGSITNHTGIDFDELVLYAGGGFLRMDSLKDGETAAIDVPYKAIDPQSGIYYELQKAYGMDPDQGIWLDELVRQGKVKKDEAYVIEQRTRILGNLLQMDQAYGDGSYVPVRLYAFSNTAVLQDTLQVDGKTPVLFGHTVFQKELSEKLSSLSSYDIPFGVLPLTGFSSNGVELYNEDTLYDSLYFYIDTPGEINVHFFIPENATEFQIRFMENGITEENKQIWNNKTEAWEPLSEAAYQTIEDYTDEWGIISIKADVATTGAFYAPQIRVKGGAE